MAALLPARLGARYLSKIPKELGATAYERVAGRLSHYALYGFTVAMPATGITMALAGGMDLPFFWTKIKGFGKEKANKPLAKLAYQTHSWLGFALVYLIPVHIGAAFFHAFKGQKIFARINPFVY